MFAWWGRVVVRARWVVLAVAGGAGGRRGHLGRRGVRRAQRRRVRRPGERVAPGRVARIDRRTGPAGRRRDRALLQRRPPRWTTRSSATRSPTPWPRCASARGRRRVTWYDTRAPGAGRRATGTPPTRCVKLPAATRTPARRRSRRCDPRWPPPGLRTDVGGLVAFLATPTPRSVEDIARAELLSMPVLLVLLVLIFGGLVAAGMPAARRRAGHPRRVRGGPRWSHGHRRLGLRDQRDHPARPRAWRSTTRCSSSAGSGRSWPPAHHRRRRDRRAP